MINSVELSGQASSLGSLEQVPGGLGGRSTSKNGSPADELAFDKALKNANMNATTNPATSVSQGPAADALKFVFAQGKKHAMRFTSVVNHIEGASDRSKHSTEEMQAMMAASKIEMDIVTANFESGKKALEKGVESVNSLLKMQ